jgi:hypothetical protein
MVKAAENRARDDRAGRRRHQTVRDLLAEALVRSRGVEVGCVVVGDPIEMALVDEEDVVEELAAEAAHEALGHRVHVRCADSGLDDANTGSACGTIEGSAVLVVAIPDKEPGRGLLHGGVPDLLGSPLLGGAPGSGHMNHTAGALVDQEEEEQRPEQEIIGLDEVAGPGVEGVVPDEYCPGLAARATTSARSRRWR